MKRRIASIITALALCLSLLPGTARAAGEVQVTIGGTPLVSGEQYVPDDENGGVKQRTNEEKYLEFDGNTLTLHGGDVYGGMTVSGGELTIMVASAFTLYAGDAPCALTINSGSAVILEGKANLFIWGVNGGGTLKTTEAKYNGIITLQSPSAAVPAVSGTSLHLNSSKSVLIYSVSDLDGEDVPGEVFDNASVHIDAGAVTIIGTVPDDWSKLDIKAPIGFLIVNGNPSIIKDSRLWAMEKIEGGVINLETVKIPTRYENPDGDMIYYTPAVEENPATLTGTGTLSAEGTVQALTIGEDVTLTVPEKKTLTISGPGKLTNNGTIVNEGTISIAEEAIPEGQTASEAIKGLDLSEESTGKVMVGTATYTNSGEPVVKGNLTFVKDTPAEGAGYNWDGGTLTLTGVAIEGTVTLPDDTVTIEANGNCSITALAVSGTNSTQLKITGTGKLTVEERIDISNGNHPSLTVDAKATLEAKKGIYVADSGNINGTITVNGTLIAHGGSGTAVSSGQVIVNNGGKLEVFGNIGISPGGMVEGAQTAEEKSVFDGAFTVKTGGEVSGTCDGWYILVSHEFPEGTNPNTVIVFPDGYLANGYKVERFADGNIGIAAGGGPFSISSANKSPATGRYTITVNAGNHGTISGSASHTSAAAGTRVSLAGVTATPEAGYRFAGWASSEVAVAGDGTFTMPGKNVTITAIWEGISPLNPPANPGSGGGGGSSHSHGTPMPPKPAGSTPSWPNPYYDVEAGVWYYGAVRYVTEHGLMNGYSNALFGPDNYLTRAQLVQILYNQEGRPPVTGGSVFTDVADDAWCASAIMWAVENGIVGGYGDGRFGPNDNITREQLAVMLWRYAGSPAAANGELNFKDADAVSGYALEAMHWAVENGILNGYGNGLLGPQGMATRAQAAQMLKNFIENERYLKH